MHTDKYVMKIVEEYGYTLEDVRRQVYKYSGLDLSIISAIYYLGGCPTEEIRRVLNYKLMSMAKERKLKMKEINELRKWLVNNGIATEKEIELVSYLNGYNVRVLNDILYIRTGYHSRDKYEYYEK